MRERLVWWCVWITAILGAAALFLAVWMSQSGALPPIFHHDQTLQEKIRTTRESAMTFYRVAMLPVDHALSVQQSQRFRWYFETVIFPSLDAAEKAFAQGDITGAEKEVEMARLLLSVLEDVLPHVHPLTLPSRE